MSRSAAVGSLISKSPHHGKSHPAIKLSLKATPGELAVKRLFFSEIAENGSN